jgi:hypothetical protein
VIVYTDPGFSAQETREALFNGNVIVLTRLKSVAALVEYADAQLRDVFAPSTPETAAEDFAPAELAAMLGQWKPAFIHDPISNRLVEKIIEEAGFAGGQTYYDLPKPRTAFPEGQLNTGVAFAFPWHRDVWYSAPRQQINWWLPVSGAAPNNIMSFDPQGFASAVRNNSGEFDYYANNAARHSTAKQVGRETQVRPGADGHVPVEETVVLPSAGSIMLFSGAQLHRSLPNTSGKSRYSIDFRTVDASDLVEGRGAELVDTHCTGTAIRDFRRVSDGALFDEDLVVSLFGAPPADAELVFVPAGA